VSRTQNHTVKDHRSLRYTAKPDPSIPIESARHCLPAVAGARKNANCLSATGPLIAEHIKYTNHAVSQPKLYAFRQKFPLGAVAVATLVPAPLTRQPFRLMAAATPAKLPCVTLVLTGFLSATRIQPVREYSPLPARRVKSATRSRVRYFLV
jgi:hypothetical protein